MRYGLMAFPALLILAASGCSPNPDAASLHKAAEEGRADKVRSCIDRGVAVNIQDPTGRTALHAAAERRHENVVRTLLAAGANPNARSIDGETPLHAAVRSGDAIVAGLLLDAGADATARTEQGHTPLHMVAGTKNAVLAGMLLAKGADVDAGRTYETPTPLEFAVDAEDTEIIRFLLDVGATPNGLGKGMTPLHRAAYQGDLSTVKLLVERGADVSVRDEYRGTPLSMARRRPENTRVIEYLKSQGAQE